MYSTELGKSPVRQETTQEKEEAAQEEVKEKLDATARRTRFLGELLVNVVEHFFRCLQVLSFVNHLFRNK
jgi:hypothetical protein